MQDQTSQLPYTPGEYFGSVRVGELPIGPESRIGDLVAGAELFDERYAIDFGRRLGMVGE